MTFIRRLLVAMVMAVPASTVGISVAAATPAPYYIGDHNTTGECHGSQMGDQPADLPFDPRTDVHHRVVQVKLDTPQDVPAPDATVHFAGINVNVLLPSDYASSNRRYPVLYLLVGGSDNQNTWLSMTDILKFTDPMKGQDAAIVVMPADSYIVPSVEWRNDRWHWERIYIERLIPYIDSHFRTFVDRAHRAIAGLSNGGGTAMHDAARHPDLFAAAASFSGNIDFTVPTGLALNEGEQVAQGSCDGDHQNRNQDEVYGDPVAGSIWWHDANPYDLAGNLRGMSLYIASGNGVPCNQNDLAQEVTDAESALANPISNALNAGFPTWVEATVLTQSISFETALTRAGIAYRSDLYGTDSTDPYGFTGCGVHTFPYWQEDLHRFWRQMLAAFGQAPPTNVNYRTADSLQNTVGLVATSVWGWTFTPDPRRAPEFLDVAGASRSGLTLKGSGQTGVTTAPFFRPGEQVELTGALQKTVTADLQGRISFTVDLGSAHASQQYTAAETAMEQVPGYFATRSVTFRPTAGSEAGNVVAIAAAPAPPETLPNTLPNTAGDTSGALRSVPAYSIVLLATALAARTRRRRG